MEDKQGLKELQTISKTKKFNYQYLNSFEGLIYWPNHENYGYGKRFLPDLQLFKDTSRNRLILHATKEDNIMVETPKGLAFVPKPNEGDKFLKIDYSFSIPIEEVVLEKEEEEEDYVSDEDE